jgi:hypothetical protein
MGKVQAWVAQKLLNSLTAKDRGCIHKKSGLENKAK